MSVSVSDNSSPGDWCHLIVEDFTKIGIHMTDDHIQNTPLKMYKYHI